MLVKRFISTTFAKISRLTQIQTPALLLVNTASSAIPASITISRPFHTSLPCHNNNTANNFKNFNTEDFAKFSNLDEQSKAARFIQGLKANLQNARAKIVSASPRISISSSPTTATAQNTTTSYKAPTPPVGVPLSKVLSNAFPLPFSDAYQQWMERSRLQEAETEVLSFLPFYPNPDQTRSARSLKVDIGDDLYLNEFEVTQHAYTTSVSGSDLTSNKHPQEVVVLHGYGAGLAFFYKNFDALSSLPGWRLHALDLLGYGLSSRPSFTIKSSDPYERIKETESFFIESLEKWRIARGLEKFTVIAHSMGGYLASAYATRYPDRVKKLVLVSPAGVPRSPFSIEESAKRRKAEELKKKGLTVPKELEIASANARKVPAWFNFLWEKHVSPFSLIRYTGPLGPRFVSAWTSRRFARLPEDQARALHKYTYVIFNAKGSGEYALNYLLAPGAFARWPLADRAHEIPCETLWLYGSHDWMDVTGGFQAIESIKKHGTMSKLGKAEPKLAIVEQAGHHIYLDNPATFNEMMLKTFKRIEAEEKS